MGDAAYHILSRFVSLYFFGHLAQARKTDKMGWNNMDICCIRPGLPAGLPVDQKTFEA